MIEAVIFFILYSFSSSGFVSFSPPLSPTIRKIKPENKSTKSNNQLIDPSCPTERHPPHPPSPQSTTQATTGAQVHHPTRPTTTTLHNRSIHSKRTNYSNSNNNNNCRHRHRRQANTIPHPLCPTNSKYNMHNWHNSNNNNRKTTKRASIVSSIPKPENYVSRRIRKSHWSTCRFEPWPRTLWCVIPCWVSPSMVCSPAMVHCSIAYCRVLPPKTPSTGAMFVWRGRWHSLPPCISGALRVRANREHCTRSM